MHRLAAIFLIAVLLVAAFPRATGSTPFAQPADELDVQVAAIMATLTPEERVGQLMLVTFEGSSLRPDTAIAQLITQYNIGGVVLLAENDNINGQVNTPRLVQSLTQDLQQLAHASAQATTDRTTPREFVPLFIATTHAGDGQPGTQIAKDTTPLPSPMALGATWNEGYARQVGQIAGIELSAMGINMLLGPALNVAQPAQPEQSFDLGVHTFGGEPHWVGQMGQAYITGVHEGSQDRIAVIAQDFPGLGFADTRPDQEIPVVPRSLEQLRAFDLVPFHAVTGAAAGTLAAADGLQCATIRYQGETIRSLTGPVCLNEDATAQIMRLDYFRSWRDDGVMVSPPLGTHAIRRHYNVTPFPHRQVAREAFLAGNDILYLSHFGPTPTDDQLRNVTDVIRFFAGRYADDPVFRGQVDASLHRILRLKLSLYERDFSLAHVLSSVNDVNAVGGYSAELYTVAERAVTLLAPRRESLPPPPERDDNIVIFTDVRLVQQCSYCATYPLVAVNALESAIEQRYGPYADAQIHPEQVVSFSFSQLATYIYGDIAGTTAEDGQLKTNQRIGEALREVDWLVFVMLDVSPAVPESTIVRELLERESPIVERARVVTIALGAPTYLTSTEVSKFAAYYGLYSHTPPYIDAAARALFQDSSFGGAPPVSVRAVGYDVLQRTRPDPSQTLDVRIDQLDGNPVTPASATASVLTVQPDTRIVLRTTPIHDFNGNIVPDNTPVEFTITFVTDNLQTQQSAVTADGIARTQFTPSRPGRIQITASAGAATRSTTLQLNVMPEASANSTAQAASASGTRTPHLARPEGNTAAEVAGDTNGTPGDAGLASLSTPPDTPPDPATTASTAGDNAQHHLTAIDFVLSLFALTLMSIAGYTAGRHAAQSSSGGMRVVLGNVVAGLTGYVYYGVGGPGVAELYTLLDNLAPMITTLVAGAVGLLYTWWLLRHTARHDQP